MSEERKPAEEGPSRPERKWLLDSKRAHDAIALGLLVACAALLVVDLAYDQHGHFDYEEWTGFHAAFGFVAYVCIVQAAKILREFVKRDEDYYGE